MLSGRTLIWSGSTRGSRTNREYMRWWTAINHVRRGRCRWYSGGGSEYRLNVVVMPEHLHSESEEIPSHGTTRQGLACSRN